MIGTTPDPGEQPPCRGDHHDGRDADDHPVIVCAGAASVVVSTKQHVHCLSPPSSASWMGRSHRARTEHPATSGNRPDPVRIALYAWLNCDAQRLNGTYRNFHRSIEP